MHQLAALVAHLVHAAAHRPSLADLPTRFFAELDDELRRHGVRASLLAGLFGLKLRTYHDHVRRARAVGDRWWCADYAIPLGDYAGWPAAVYDHMRAVVETSCDKLDAGPSAAAADQVGGSTYTFEVGPDHPLDGEVLALLAETRRPAEDPAGVSRADAMMIASDGMSQ